MKVDLVLRRRRPDLVAARIEFGHDRNIHGFENDASANARFVGDAPLDERLVAEVRWIVWRAAVGLDADVIEFAVVFADPAGHGVGVLEDGTGLECDPALHSAHVFVGD